MQWLEISIEPLPDMIEELCLLLENEGIDGLVIDNGQDFEDFLENNKMYWDYVDEELRDRKRDQNELKFYLSDDNEGRARYIHLKELTSRFSQGITIKTIRDEDWESNWMQYYKPIPVGTRLLIVPSWESIPVDQNRLVLRLNPGLIFGTGSHPTTAMCLEELEKYAPGASRVLDLGCGSGILAIASLLLGAKSAVGYDIDPKAPETAMSNASYNGITSSTFHVEAGDILGDRRLRQKIGKMKYELITANIVADVIIALANDVPLWLESCGTFICSGIIEGRQDEVQSALTDAGMSVIGHIIREDWHCFTAVLSKQ